jgi:hypothetical protein
MTGTWIRRTLGAAAAAVGLLAVGAAAPGPAGAGGGEWMYPVRDRYEPGQDVLMVGYTQTAEPWSEAGPYYAWLRVDPAAESRAAAGDAYVYVDPTDIRLAPVVIDDTLVDGYHGRRATISFTLPSDVPRGHYQLILCNDPCTQAPGYLIPETLSVGVPPQYEVIRDWPATEPAIRWLEDDALLFSPDGQTVTAADYRAGRVPPPVTLPPPEAPAAPATTVAPEPSRVAGDARSRVPGEAPTATARPAEADDGPGAASGAAGGTARDEGWAPLGAWLAGLAALALASGALVARGRHGRRAAPVSDAAAAGEAGAVRAAEGAGAATQPGEGAEGAEDAALVRT